jgi:excisionase family DNA binding protein
MFHRMARQQTSRLQSLLPSTQEALRALVRLLARDAARQWLTSAAFEEPIEVDNEAEAGAAHPPSRG